MTVPHIAARQESAGGLMTGVRIQRSQRSTNTSKCHMPSEINHLSLTLKNPHFTRLCIYVLRMTVEVNIIISLNSVNNLELQPGEVFSVRREVRY